MPIITQPAPLLAKIARYKKFIMVIGVIIIFVATVYLYQIGQLTPESIVSFIETHPTSAPLIFTLLYALMVAFLLPTLPMNLGAGFLFGPILGGIISIASASLGASAAFAISRYLAHDYINRKFRHSAWTWIQKEIQEKNWKIIAFTRANPAFPFSLLSYFFGLTPVSFKGHLWATALFILPGSFAFALIGHSIGDIVLQGEAASIMRSIVIFSIAITVLITFWFVTKKYFRVRNKKSNTYE